MKRIERVKAKETGVDVGVVCYLTKHEAPVGLAVELGNCWRM